MKDFKVMINLCVKTKPRVLDVDIYRLTHTALVASEKYTTVELENDTTI